MSDEPTSAPDVQSEKLVQEALEGIMKRRTTLILAHRLSTIRSADVIFFVKGGEITERGTFDELYKRREGDFRALVDSSSAFAASSAYSGGEGIHNGNGAAHDNVHNESMRERVGENRKEDDGNRSGGKLMVTYPQPDPAQGHLSWSLRLRSQHRQQRPTSRERKISQPHRRPPA